MRGQQTPDPSVHTRALLFSTDDRPHRQQFKEIVQQGWLDRYLGYPRYGHFTAAGMVLTSAPYSLPGLWAVDSSARLYVQAGGVHTVKLADVFKMCIRPAKFTSNCEVCPVYDRPGVCLSKLFWEWAAANDKHGLMWDKPGNLEILEDPVTEFRGKTLGNFEFATPFETRDWSCRIPNGTLRPLRRATSNWLDQVDKNREELSSRSKRSAMSRRAKKVCETSCVFNKWCDLAHNNYRCRAVECQHSDTDTYNTTNGPYSRERAEEVHAAWFNKRFSDPHGRLSDEQIASVASNAGCELKALGWTWIMVGTDSDLQTVHFVNARRAGHEMFMRFDDAVQFMKTPWKTANGKLGKADIYYPKRVMTPAELTRYALLRLFPNARGECAGWGNTYPEVQAVHWEHAQNQFRVDIRNRASKYVAGVEDIARIFEIRCAIKWIPAGAEEDSPGPMRGIRPSQQHKRY